MSAFYTAGLSIPAKNYVYGLGGADVTNVVVQGVFDDLEKVADGTLDCDLRYIGI